MQFKGLHHHRLQIATWTRQGRCGGISNPERHQRRPALIANDLGQHPPETWIATQLCFTIAAFDELIQQLGARNCSAVTPHCTQWVQVCPPQSGGGALCYRASSFTLEIAPFVEPRQCPARNLAHRAWLTGKSADRTIAPVQPENTARLERS
jgi:hypothetical protein